jgi:hypothetical protein
VRAGSRSMDGCWVSPDARPGTAFGARPFWLLFGALRRRSGANGGAGPKGEGQSLPRTRSGDARSHAKK